MALEFHQPGPINPYANNPVDKLKSFNENLSSIGNDFEKRAHDKRQEALQSAMFQMSKSAADREARKFSYEYGDPNATTSTYGSPLDLGRQPWAQTSDAGSTKPWDQTPDAGYGAEQGPQLPGVGLGMAAQRTPPASGMGTPLMPSPISYPRGPAQGPQPEGAVDYTAGQSGPQPQGSIDHTFHFNNWKAQGMPSTYNHPDLGGPASPLDQYTKSLNDPRVGSVQREGMLKGALTQSEIAKNLAAAGTSSFYQPEQVRALLPGLAGERLIQSYGGKPIPKDAVHQGMTLQGQTSTQNRFGLKTGQEFAGALDPNKMRGGNMGLLQRKINSADALDNLYQQSGGNPTKQQLTEMALGTANMLANGNLAAEGIVQGLLPQSLKGDMMAGAQWLKNKPLGTEQQAFAKNLHDTMMREKQVAQKQLRTAQMQDAASWQGQVDPTVYNNVMRARGLNGYSLGPTGELVEPPSAGGPAAGGGQNPQEQPTTVQRKGKDGQMYTYTLNPATGKYE